MTGEIDTREASAYGLGDVINRTSEVSLKPFVTQITGPLIRVIGDRFPAVVKTAILSCLGYCRSNLVYYCPKFLRCLSHSCRNYKEPL
jgi:hypothetical protein